MKHQRVSQRYAKALFDLAVELHVLEPVHNDMLLVHQTIMDSRELRFVLKSPVIKNDLKIKIFDSLFGTHIHSLSLRFLSIVTKKNRETNLEEIAQQVIQLYEETKGVKTAVVRSAVPMKEAERSRLIAQLKIKLQSEIKLVEETDKSLIGGFILKIGDLEYDASIVRKLHDIAIEVK